MGHQRSVGWCSRGDIGLPEVKGVVEGGLGQPEVRGGVVVVEG